jgi:hypothetical protein
MPAHPSLMKNRSVVLGFSSPGNGGKAYHDYVKVTYPSSIELQSVNSAEQTIN